MYTVLGIIEELKELSSTNAKIELLNKNKDNDLLKDVLYYTYNSHLRYKIANPKIINDKGKSHFVHIFQLLDHLASNNINDGLREETGKLLNDTPEELRALFIGMITKDLRINIGSTLINRVWAGLIPSSDGIDDIKPMLASKFDLDKPPTGEYILTEKLDGIRCMIVLRSNSDVKLYTRQGKLIDGCLDVEYAIRHTRLNNVVFDGELLAKDCSYEDVYKETTKRVKNKNDIKTGIEFRCFDVLTLEEFENKKCIAKYNTRRILLDSITESEYFKVVPVLYKGNNMDKVVSLLDKYRELGAEGLMVNLSDKIYEFKRSKNILKLKVMQTCDLKIIGFQEGTGKYAGKLGALLLDYKGSELGCGSGFSDADREYFWNNKDELLGRVVEVSYFEETKDKDGKLSLRFPVYKMTREEDKEVSYN